MHNCEIILDIGVLLELLRDERMIFHFEEQKCFGARKVFL